MYRQLCQRMSSARSPAVVQRAKYKNMVASEALCQLDSKCLTYCPPLPRKTRQQVTVVGAGSDVGRYACLFLKQQSVVKVLAMYDDAKDDRVIGIATDLAHIDTSTSVEAFQGRKLLPKALSDADVVLICGGKFVMPPSCNILDQDLFFQNQTLVRSITLACARFCPHVVLVVQTPPVDCNFALAMHTLKANKAYDKRRLIGMNSINSMRANQMFATSQKSEPSGSFVPIICGTGRDTRVPVWSATAAYFCLSASQRENMTRLVRGADDLICRVKSNKEQGHLSLGFATARCVVSIMKGLFERPAFIDSALVEQDDPGKCYGMPICATPITFGKYGITKYHIPKLTDEEKNQLELSKCDLEDMLNLGRCHAVGDDYYTHPCKICPPYVPPPCPVCMPSQNTKWPDN